MDSRLIFLHCVWRLKQRDGSAGKGESHDQLSACRKAEGTLVPKLTKWVPRKTVVDKIRSRTKTDTGRRGE